jgi:hypothetical protein
MNKFKLISRISLFFFGAPTLIAVSVLFLLSLSNTYSPPPVTAQSVAVLGEFTADSDNIIYPNIFGTFTTADARDHIIKNYLHRYSSPLEPFAKAIVDVSDKYSLDYRLLVAIAQQESNLCKRIPENSHNCWGFGIYGDLVTRFSSYPEALEKVAKAIKRDYIDKGLDTPEEIMAKYTPPSLEKGGPWAKGVNRFMTDLE